MTRGLTEKEEITQKISKGREKVEILTQQPDAFFVYVIEAVLNTAMICLHIIYSCFPAIREGLSGCDRDHMVHKA